MDAKADKMSKSDPSASQAMKQAAQLGKQQGLSSKQQQAAQDMQQNQQASAQQNQKQVEVGLDQILNKLKEAERKRLEELARQLAQMQQLIAELVQRQSGHNIDNLLTQGGPKTAGTGRLQGTRRIDRHVRPRPQEPPCPAAGPAVVGQSGADAERNARDIARQAESLPDPAPAAKLTQAAGHMERAIVHLREQQVDRGAYKPPQVDAAGDVDRSQKAG